MTPMQKFALALAVASVLAIIIRKAMDYERESYAAM